MSEKASNVVKLSDFTNSAGVTGPQIKTEEAWPEYCRRLAREGGPISNRHHRTRIEPIELKPGEVMTSQGFVVGKDDPDGVGLMGLDID